MLACTGCKQKKLKVRTQPPITADKTSRLTASRCHSATARTLGARTASRVDEVSPSVGRMTYSLPSL